MATAGNEQTRQRLQFIDAARTVAMLFVFASHFAEVYFAPSGEARSVFRQITLIASPTFMTISGVLIGFLWQTRQGSFPALHARLIDRGLFLLTVGHLLIAGSNLAQGQAWYTHLDSPAVFITDVIGLCMIVTPWLVNRLSKPATIAVGLLAMCASWFVASTWHPNTVRVETLQEAFVGSMQGQAHILAFPLLPWFSLNLIATALGRLVGERFLDGDEDGMASLLFSVGGGSVASALVLKGLYVAGRFWLHNSLWYQMSSPFQKYPPSPAYFLFYGGLGVCVILAGSLAAERHRFRIVGPAAKIGQTSLMMFVLQAYIYYSGLYLLRGMLVPHVWWPIVFVASIPLILVPAYYWHRFDMNRFITVGYQQWRAKEGALVDTPMGDPESTSADNSKEMAGLRRSLPAHRRSETTSPRVGSGRN
jgi:uncharacterized membrane protein